MSPKPTAAWVTAHKAENLENSASCRWLSKVAGRVPFPATSVGLTLSRQLFFAVGSAHPGRKGPSESGQCQGVLEAIVFGCLVPCFWSSPAGWDALTSEENYLYTTAVPGCSVG